MGVYRPTNPAPIDAAGFFFTNTTARFCQNHVWFCQKEAGNGVWLGQKCSIYTALFVPFEYLTPRLLQSSLLCSSSSSPEG